MSDVTVAQFAEVLKVPVDRLLVQLESAGIQVSGPQALISDEAKLELLTHLRRSHGASEPTSKTQAGAAFNRVELGQAVGRPASHGAAQRQRTGGVVERQDAEQPFQTDVGEVGLVPETGRIQMFREGGREQRRAPAAKIPFVRTLQQGEGIEAGPHR